VTPVWGSDTPPDDFKVPASGWLRVLRRGVPLAILVFGGLVVLLMVRLAERPFHGQQRPWTPHITCFVCRNAFRIIGLPLHLHGAPLAGPGAAVSNHVSWLDIFALNAGKRIYFVAKSEVARWPAIGWLARSTGTVFIRRNARDAKVQAAVFEDRLSIGHKLLFFPEGTSTDGSVVLPFKTTLFQAFFNKQLGENLRVQPVTLRYVAPQGGSPRYYGWWGEMEFAPNLIKVLATPRQGSVEVIYHPALKVADFADRKALAKACEDAVRAGLNA